MPQNEPVTANTASGFIRSRVVQVHPTLRCNLACTHCYSSSGPRESDDQSTRSLVEKLSLLRDEGFDVVSFSGGEPLVYRHFAEVAYEAKRLGFRVNMITNGVLLDQRRLNDLKDVISRIGVSIDGTPSTHDRYRGKGSFARTERALTNLHESDAVFGIAHCVTRESISELPWMLDFCLEHKASLLQLHPIVRTGRATNECGDQILVDADRARLFLIAEMLKIQAADNLQIQLDLVPVSQLLLNQSSYPMLRDIENPPGRIPLAELVNPVILDENGALWPLAYGMHDSQRIAAGEGESWTEGLDGYIESNAAPLRHLLTDAFDRLQTSEHEFIDWYAHAVDCSYRNG